MPIQVDGAFVRAPCPVPSYPAYEPNPGSVFPSLSTKACSSRGADIVMQSSTRFWPRIEVKGSEGSGLGTETERYIAG